MFAGNEFENTQWREEIITSANFHRRGLEMGLVGHVEEVGFR